MAFAGLLESIAGNVEIGSLPWQSVQSIPNFDNGAGEFIKIPIELGEQDVRDNIIVR